MNTNQTGTDAAQRLFGYDIQDSGGNKVGSVDGVWVDTATDRPEFAAVKTGWIFGQNHVMPLEQANISDANQTIQVPYSEDQIKNGPSFGTDDDLSTQDEDQIYSYYGMQRSTQTSPTGYAAGGGPSTTTTGTQQTGQNWTDQGEQDLTLSEEELKVGKRQEQTGEVRLRKVVRTEHEEVPVELRREEVDIERVPASQLDATQVPDTAFQDREIDIPVSEEEPVVAKEARVTGQVQVNKTAQTEMRTVGADVRKEEVEIDEEGNVDLNRANSDINPTNS